MKPKSLLVLAVAAAGLLAAGVFLNQRNRADWQSGTDLLGKRLLPDLAINEVARIELTGTDGTVSLARREGQWVVEQCHGYPADYGKVSQFVKQAANETIQQSVTVDEDNYDRLDLLAPDAEHAERAGVDMRLFNAAGAELAMLRFGKQHLSDNSASQNPMLQGRSFPDGRYILRPVGENEKVVLVTNPFRSVSVDPTNWLDKQFLELRNVHTAWLERDGETAWRIETDSESDEPALDAPIPENAELKQHVLSGTLRALAYARFDDVADPALSPEETGMDNPTVFHAVNDDNVECTVRIGKKQGGAYYVQATVAVRPEEPPADERDDEDSEAEQEDGGLTVEEIKDKAETLNERLDGWTFLVPEQTVNKLLRERNEFLKVTEKEEEKDQKADAEEPGPEDVHVPEAKPPQAGDATPPPPPPPPPAPQE